MKKIAALLLVFAMCLTLLAACGGTGDVPVESSTPAPTQSEEPQAPERQEPAASEPPAVSEEPAESEAPVEDETPGESAESETSEGETAEDYEFEGPGIFETVLNHPDSYLEEAVQQGRVEVVTYDNGIQEKHFNIYLPYGYDAGNQSYNVLYLMHGGGAGSPENFIREDRLTVLQKVVDNMIQNGDVEPFILVAPSWRTDDVDPTAENYHAYTMELTDQFAREEFVQYVIPLVDGSYRTNATREGRAFGGFSMGGVTTWNIFLYDLAFVKYFIPISGDCWALEQTGGMIRPEETVEVLEQAALDQGYTGKDFMMYIFTGTQDIAMPNMVPQIYAMQDSEVFLFGENTFFGAYIDGVHGDPWTKVYLYNALPLLWKDN